MQEVRRTLPGAPADTHSRYLEAIIDNKMLLACRSQNFVVAFYCYK